MKKVTLFLGLFLLMLFPSACSEDEAVESLVLFEKEEDVLKLDKPIDDLELKLETDLKLQARVLNIKTELNQDLAPNMEALAIIGKEILRSRGVDPDTVFSGSDDIRFALVPMVTEILDSLNAEMNKDGYHIESAFLKKDSQQQTGDNNSISVTQDLQWGRHWGKRLEDAADCFDQGGALVMLAGMSGAMGWTKTAGSVIATVAGVSIPGWAGVAMTGGGYYAYRVGKCHGKVARGETPYLADEASYLESCRDKIFSASGLGGLNPQTPDMYHCKKALEREMHRVMEDAKARFGDTLIVAATHN